MGFVRDAELLLAVLMLTNNAAAGSNTTNFSVLPRTAARYSSTALCRTHGETCSSHDAAQYCRGFLSAAPPVATARTAACAAPAAAARSSPSMTRSCSTARIVRCQPEMYDKPGGIVHGMSMP